LSGSSNSLQKVFKMLKGFLGGPQIVKPRTANAMFMLGSCDDIYINVAIRLRIGPQRIERTHQCTILTNWLQHEHIQAISTTT
jgi:hypothetical protein